MSEDVQDAQVKARQEIGERGVGFEDVDVRVDRLDGREPGRRRGTLRLRPGEKRDAGRETRGDADGEESDGERTPNKCGRHDLQCSVVR